MTNNPILREQAPEHLPLSDSAGKGTNLILPALTLDERLAHFSEEVYNIEPGTTLRKLMSVLLGDAGAGAVRKRYLYARIQSALQGTNFYDLDRFYGALFNLRRRADEQFDFDPHSATATSEQWFDAEGRDASYRSRIEQMASALTFGPTATGIELLAEAILGTDVDVFEVWTAADRDGRLYSDLEALDSPALYSDLESVGTYADLEAGTTDLGLNRWEFEIWPRRPITLEERYDLTRVLDKIRPAETRFEIKDGTTGTLNELTPSGIWSDSNLWYVRSKTVVRSDYSDYYSSATPGTGEAVTEEQPQPPMSNYQGEAWSINPGITAVSAYAELMGVADTIVDNNNSQEVTFLDGTSRSYLPEHAIRPLPEVVAARATRDGVMVSSPLGGPRKLPDPASVLVQDGKVIRPYSYSLASLTGLTIDGVDIEALQDTDRTLGVNYRRSKEERFWSTPERLASSSHWEVLEFRLRSAERVNKITFEVPHFPHRTEVQYYDESSGEWLTVHSTNVPSSYPARLPSLVVGENLHPQHSWTGHWIRVTAKITPSKSSIWRIRQQRLATGSPPVDGQSVPIPYSLGVRDIDFGYEISGPEDLPSRFVLDGEAIGSSVDVLGSKLVFDQVSYEARDLLRGDAWRCQPQPIPSAVVNLYIDNRDAQGAAQAIDRMYLEPTVAGPLMNLYYSNDEVSSAPFESSDAYIDIGDLSISGATLTSIHGLTFDTPSSYIDIANRAIQFTPSTHWWAGFEIVPGFDSSVTDMEILSWGGNGIYIDDGEIQFRTISGDVVSATCNFLANQTVKLGVEVAYGQVTIHTSVLDTTTTGSGPIDINTMVNTPSTILLGSTNPGGSWRLQKFVLKQGSTLDAEDFFSNTRAYVLKADYPSLDDSRTDNAILRFHPNFLSADTPAGLVGGPATGYESMEWTPIPRDYILQKGYINIPVTKAKHWKLEFTNLAVSPMEVSTPIEQRIKTFPAHANPLAEDTDSHEFWSGVTTDVELITPWIWKADSTVRDVDILTSAIYPTDPTALQRIRAVSWVYGFLPWHMGTERPRFRETGRHVYREHSWLHKEKISFSVGLKSLKLYRTLHSSSTSPSALVERFYDTTNLASSNWVLSEGDLVSIEGSEAVSKVFTTRNEIEALHFATQQTDAVQIIPDDDFRNPALKDETWDSTARWHTYNDSLITWLQNEQSALVIRSILATQINNGDAKTLPELLPHAVFSLNPQAAATAEDDGGIESALVVASQDGQIHAAARITAITDLADHLYLQIVDANGDVHAEEPILASAGETVEWTASLRLGSTGGTPIAQWDPDRNIVDHPVHPVFAGVDALTDVSGSTEGLGELWRVRIIQKTATADAWKVDRLSLFDESIVWSFSNDGGSSWVTADGLIRNNAFGRLQFATPGSGLTWKVTTYRRNMHVNSLQIRPIYRDLINLRTASPYRGPNVSQYDVFPPITLDPEFRRWDHPVPQWWWREGRKYTDLNVIGQIPSNDLSTAYDIDISEDASESSITTTSAWTNMRINVTEDGTTDDEGDWTYDAMAIDVSEDASGDSASLTFHYDETGQTIEVPVYIYGTGADGGWTPSPENIIDDLITDEALRLWIDPADELYDGGQIPYDRSGRHTPYLGSLWPANISPAGYEPTTDLSVTVVDGEADHLQSDLTTTPSGDFDVRLKCAAADWSSAGANYLVSQWTSLGSQRAVTLYRSGSSLAMLYSINGSGSEAALAVSATSGLTDGETYWLRWVFTSATATLEAFTSVDGVSWTSHGTDTNAAAHTLFDSSSGWEVFGLNGAQNITTDTTVYAVEVIDGSTTIIDLDFTRDAQAGEASSVTDLTGNTWTFNGSLTVTDENGLTPNTKALRLPGTTGNYVSTPDAAALSVTGDIDIRVHLALDDWASGSTQSVVGKTVSGGIDYMVEVQGSGVLRLAWSSDGTFGAGFAFADSSVAPTVADGEPIWIRCTLDVSTGNVNFYTGTDGSSWTQLGAADQGGAGATSIYDSTNPVEFGGAYTGTSNMCAGLIYAVEVYDGIDGTQVVDVDFDRDADLFDTSFTGNDGLTYTVNQSAATTNDPLVFGAGANADHVFDGTKYIYLPGTSGNDVISADKDLTGDVDIRVKLRHNASATGYTDFFSDRAGTAGEAVLRYDATVTSINFLWFESGAAKQLSAAHSASDGEIVWFRAVRDNDNGSGLYVITLYESSDGETWTQIGTTTGAAAAAPTAQTRGFNLGGNAIKSELEVFACLVYSDLTETTKVFDLDVNRDTIASDHSTITDAEGNVWTVNRSAAPSFQTTIIDRPGWLGGGSQWITVPASADWDVDNGGEKQMVVAFRAPTTQAAYAIPGGAGYVDVAPRWYWYQDNLNDQWLLAIEDGTTGNYVGTGVTHTPGDPVVLSSQLTASAVRTRFNGTTGQSSRVVGAVDTFEIFKAGQICGLVHFVAVFDRALTDAELEALEGIYG